MPERPSEHEQHDVAVLGVDAPGVDVDRAVGAERARDDRALRVARGLLGRQRAAAHELAHQRVVVGELLQHAVAQQVGARVADVPEGDAPVVHQRGGDRGAHAGGVAGRGARARGCGGWPRRWSAAATPRSPSPGRVSVRVMASTASAEATSPALAPPMPSATTKSGDATRCESSLERRTWPDVGGRRRSRRRSSASGRSRRAVGHLGAADDRATSPARSRRSAASRWPFTKVPLVEPEVLDVRRRRPAGTRARGGPTRTRRPRAPHPPPGLARTPPYRRRARRCLPGRLGST